MAKKKRKMVGVLQVGALAVGLGVGLSLAGRPAHADTTVYNASSVCSWDPALSLAPTFQGWVENYGTSGIERRVSCGLILTNDIASSTTDDVFVYYGDNNTGSNMEDDVICNVYSCSASGSNCANENTQFGTSPDGLLYFTDLAKPYLGIPNVSCAIPNKTSGGAKSRIEEMYMIH